MIEWVAAGLNPEDFWVQTPRSFVAIMEGVSRRAKRESDAKLSLAWHIEAFARQKRLKPLNQLLGIKPKAQSTDEMLAVFQAFVARGVPMNIKKLH